MFLLHIIQKCSKIHFFKNLNIVIYYYWLNFQVMISVYIKINYCFHYQSKIRVALTWYFFQNVSINIDVGKIWGKNKKITRRSKNINLLHFFMTYFI